MVSFVLLFTETLAEEYVAVGYLYELVPTSREDDRFAVIGKVLAFARKGRYTERTFLPTVAEWLKHLASKPHVRGIHLALDKEVAVGSLVVRAPDSGPEGLGSMPVPPNTLRVHTGYVLVHGVRPKFLWAESRVQGTRFNFLPLQFHA
ncbi:uncharacterized protein TNCV_539171 [Trichonephila clavipes]|nr:uncharacterized protein TNCV_539171 [Trichonephila clavipes]